MIKLKGEGYYRLIETKDQTKILTLIDPETLKEKAFAWVNAADIGELLVTTHKKHKLDNILVLGKYRLYEVKDEPKLTDLEHLELFVGQGVWQGYLLLTGLPTKKNIRRRIVSTDELITKSS